MSYTIEDIVFSVDETIGNLMSAKKGLEDCNDPLLTESLLMGIVNNAKMSSVDLIDNVKREFKYQDSPEKPNDS